MKSQRPNRNVLLVSGAMLLLVVFVTFLISWSTVNRIERAHRRTIGNALTTVLETTLGAFHIWADDRKDDAGEWAGSDPLRRITLTLLEEEPNPAVLVACPVQQELRRLLQPVMKAHGYLGYFIVAPDYLCLASMRDSNIGTLHPMTDFEGGLDKVFQGEVRLSQPQPARILLPDDEGNLVPGVATMFVAAPIYDDQGEIVAALTLRIDPCQDFTPIARQGRIGDTGETYVFDAKGRMLTESRFPEMLRAAGLLGPEEQAAFKIQIRDPGVDLTRNGHSQQLRDEQPLTLMAASAVAGERGLDLDGYRDYRGVPVVGAWEWNSELDLGVTTEQDWAESYNSLHSIRRLVVGTVILIVVLFLALTIIQVLTHRRTLLLTEELQVALAEVKALSGLLPICASCKNIRDDSGYWQQIESYISRRSEAEFSHGICPDCIRKLYGDEYLSD